MPIQGLTNRELSFPQIGIIRKGGEKTNPKAPGKDLDYFRFDTEDAEARQLFLDIYGAQPRAINAYLPYITADENFEAWKEEWVGGGLRHRCDGVTCTIWQTPQMKYSHEPKPCPGKCKQVGRLKIIIPELRRFAFVTVLTTSIHDIIEIDRNLRAIEARCGTLQGVPLVIKRVAREISMPGEDGKRVRRTKWLVTVEAQPRWVDLQLAAYERALTLPAAQHPPALALPPAPDAESDNDDILEQGSDPAIDAEAVEVDPVADLGALLDALNGFGVSDEKLLAGINNLTGAGLLDLEVETLRTLTPDALAKVVHAYNLKLDALAAEADRKREGK